MEWMDIIFGILFVGIQTNMVDAILEGLLLFVKITYLTFVAIVKACLPVGFLPRKSVAGEIVLITGSGSGIGRLMAIEFAKLGSKLVLWDVNEDGNNETKAIVERAGGKAFSYTVNLAKREQIYEAAEQVKKDVGAVDILINNAGIVTGKKLYDCPDELMELTMAVNTSALFYTGKAFLPSMLQRNHGHIVTIASMAGKCGAAGLVDYCASKHGAVGFHESITAEIAAQHKTGVHTTVVCPFYINTGMFDGVQTKSPKLLPILEPQDTVDRIVEAILINQRLLCMPKFCYLVSLGTGLLPSSVIELLNEYLGINETMDTFKGRAKPAAN